jgi:hypothetical protein
VIEHRALLDVEKRFASPPFDQRGDQVDPALEIEIVEVARTGIDLVDVDLGVEAVAARDGDDEVVDGDFLAWS